MNFKEKPVGDLGWINGGFFVLNPEVITRINDDNCSWENKPLKSLAEEGQLLGYKHSGFGGRDNGLYAHDQYCEVKTIWIDLSDANARDRFL